MQATKLVSINKTQKQQQFSGVWPKQLICPVEAHGEYKSIQLVGVWKYVETWMCEG